VKTATAVGTVSGSGTNGCENDNVLETSARLLRLLSLLQSRRDWRGTELAGRLGVGLRTVRRDIDRLRDLGYPVDASPGAAGGYRLGTGAALPPLLLDDEEAVAVAISLHTTLPSKTSPGTALPRPGGWKPPAGTPASSTPDPTLSTNSPSTWLSRASISVFSTHPSSSPSCTPWPNASAKPPTPPDRAGDRARRRPARVV